MTTAGLTNEEYELNRQQRIEAFKARQLDHKTFLEAILKEIKNISGMDFTLDAYSQEEGEDWIVYRGFYSKIMSIYIPEGSYMFDKAPTQPYEISLGLTQPYRTFYRYLEGTTKSTSQKRGKDIKVYAKAIIKLIEYNALGVIKIKEAKINEDTKRNISQGYSNEIADLLNKTPQQFKDNCEIHYSFGDYHRVTISNYDRITIQLGSITLEKAIAIIKLLNDNKG